MDRVLEVLAVPPDAAAIRSAVKKRDGQELEDALAARNGVGVLHRTREEWLAHPQGRYLAGTPLIELVKIGDAPTREFAARPSRPLSGLKVVSCTHVIAGTTAARTLAEYGADVLHIARDQSFEHEALVVDVNVGMRSAWVDLRDQAHNQRFAGLLRQADVFIEGFRGRSMERLGFGVEEVASCRPGIVYLSVRGYGWEGPWGDRAAFDMEGVSTTGFTLVEGRGTGVPRFPPTLVMNDYITGYIGAAGILAALRRRNVRAPPHRGALRRRCACCWPAGTRSRSRKPRRPRASRNHSTSPSPTSPTANPIRTCSTPRCRCRATWRKTPPVPPAGCGGRPRWAPGSPGRTGYVKTPGAPSADR
ncbi:CoA transferase [Pseudoxanthomonas sp. J35]|uniref:CoA transferase n=1 Tax=Pseudoxanthomonas sp. J35 TaxID=935852 RepID=UPI0004AD2BA2|nr:CoA transferase [Pseudoxanthomonas sp. J35]